MSQERREGNEREREKMKRKTKRRTKMKMKRKMHPDIPNYLITEYSYIFAPFLEIFRESYIFAPF